MDKTVHIVNGDSTVPKIEASNLKGDIIVCRELFCEGPLHSEVGTDELWKKRYNYFESELKVSKLEYYDKSITEFVKLEDLSAYKEVILWFEYDLFCQVNLMAICTYLVTFYHKKIDYYLVCVGNEKGKDTLQTLANYSSKDFENLYENKVRLSQNNFFFAKECWNLFVENKIDNLKNFNFNKSSKFKYFQLAMNQHIKRFPNKNGLNEIDQKIIELADAESITKKQLVKQLLEWQEQDTVYGFGDLQYNYKIEQLMKQQKLKLKLIMVTFIGLFLIIGIIILVFNYINFDFVAGENSKVKWQINVGKLLIFLSLLMAFFKFVITKTEAYQDYINSTYQ